MHIEQEDIRTAEREIVRAVIDVLLGQGYALTVYNGQDDEIIRSTDADAVMAATQSADEDWLLVHKNADAPKHFAWLRFVYGNSGWDVLCDYTVNLETHLEEGGVHTLIDAWEATL